MKKNNFPDKNEWNKIVENAFASEETHIFSQRYNEKKNQMKGSISMKKNTSIKRIITGFAAAAAVCAGAMAIAPGISNSNIKNNSGTAIEETSKVQKNSFFLSASAEEMEEPDENITVSQSNEGGMLPFSGSYFFIHGTNIKNVSVSIDKGSLYKADYKMLKTVNSEGKPEYSEEDCCEYIGSSYTEAFDENRAYGFYFPEDVISKHEEELGGPSKQAIYCCYDDFNGAVLSVTAEFEDGTSESVSYTLKSGMYEVVDWNPLKINGKISDGSTPYIYGLLFEKN